LLANRHADGTVVALIIDEAQCLPDALLEEVRLLANIESASEKLLTIILAGQPELAVRLNQPSLRQLKQRVGLRCSLRR
jgi:type II secretory pathway predicted ATPase ExeA